MIGPRTIAALLCCVSCALALDPQKSLTQYSRKVWTQEDGLPQDTIRAIAQTSDGYLWLGTDEGLARFDGYEFVVFNKRDGDLPANSVAALAAGRDGVLWIGTSAGLTEYRDHHFRTYTTKQGLPDNAISQIYDDGEGTIWIVAGTYLSRFQNGTFTNFAPDAKLPVTSVRAILQDRDRSLLVAGYGVIVRMSGGKVEPVIDSDVLRGNIVTTMFADASGNLWIGGTTGMIERTAAGAIRRYDTGDGLSDPFIRAIWQDRNGNLWVGTNTGLARLENGRFVTHEHDLVRCLFEDREGDLWVGASGGLNRYRNDIFTVYGKTEGLPSDEPNTVFQDREGRVWVGFRDSGLMLFSGGPQRIYTTRDGLPNNEIFSIRQTRSGDLLIAARGGMVRMHDGRFSTFRTPDPLSRLNLFDAMEDSTGRIWLGAPSGLAELAAGQLHLFGTGEPLVGSSVIVLLEDRSGTIWAGSYGRGLWCVRKDAAPRMYTTADGLSSDQIRSLYQDPEGVLWIGTFGGGLNAFKDGKFRSFTENNGLLSDNVADISDDGESLWLSTTRGICRMPKQQLNEFSQGRRQRLEPVNYGVEDGLRSAQCAPSYPIGGGAHRTTDGRLWFTTTRGLVVFDPRAHRESVQPAAVHMVQVGDAEGQVFDLDSEVRLGPRRRRIQIRYTGIHLAAPERVRYSHRLDGLDQEWVQAGTRREINYNTLKHGSYRFRVRAEVPGAPATEQSFAFEVLPNFYETLWFRLLAGVALAASAWALYQLRLRRIRHRFALVLEERARLAREIHDTLAQGFVGIGSQLDAVAMCLPDQSKPARQHLDLARKMARHSLTEARRSVMDLRASALDSQDLAAALKSGARMWTAGSGVEVKLEVGGTEGPLPEEMEQHLLRITQEAVTNAVKHARARRIGIRLHREARKLYLRIADDGEGFEQENVFSALTGHFGLIGMRERAERLGGELRLASNPGEGTEVEVSVPLP